MDCSFSYIRSLSGRACNALLPHGPLVASWFICPRCMICYATDGLPKIGLPGLPITNFVETVSSPRPYASFPYKHS